MCGSRVYLANKAAAAAQIFQEGRFTHYDFKRATMAIASLVLALGAFVLAALSLLLSNNNRKQTNQVLQIEHKKREALGILQQVEIENRRQLNSLQFTRRLADSVSTVPDDLCEKVDQRITGAEEIGRRVEHNMKVLRDQSFTQTLKELEKTLKDCHSARQFSESTGTAVKKINSQLIKGLWK